MVLNEFAMKAGRKVASKRTGAKSEVKTKSTSSKPHESTASCGVIVYYSDMSDGEFSLSKVLES